MPKAQQKDVPKREYPDKDDGKTPSNTPGTAAPGPGVSIQFTISVGALDQHKSLNVNIPTTFLVNGQKGEES
ncbi:hypothetical protein I3842_03G129500 [Carya illinoinensis]|uniref:Uncharacterized protein n=1 Tax=Carya illinoinensis TaxID=32201 RepID=A0A922FG46_CARIL|nr:hypothetical protein I3842_03G129500 [Carya illinoinensis]